MAKKKYFTDEEKKIARRIDYKKYYQNNKEKIKIKDAENYQKNKKEILIRCKKYYQDHRNKKLIKRREQYQNDKQREKLYSKEYNKTHRKDINKYLNHKLKNDINFKLSRNIRSRLHIVIKGNQKVGSAVKDLGCTIPELKLYLESNFKDGMTWDNWKYDGWHIDHIKPLSGFNLQDREEFLKANHYTNLQPLWAEENLKKSDKFQQNTK